MRGTGSFTLATCPLRRGEGDRRAFDAQSAAAEKCALTGARVWIPVWLALGAVLGCASGPLHKRDWFEVETQHFTIASSLDREATMELASDLERFRSAVEYLQGANPAPPPEITRTQVYAFDGRGFSRPFAVRGASGTFIPTQRGGVIVLRTGKGWRGDTTRELRHEYVHFLFRNRQGINQPIWFDEGFAQFASTIEVGDESVRVGGVPAEHVQQLRNSNWLSPKRMLPLRDLGALGPKQRDVFRAQSWALVHLLLLDQGSPARARSDAQRYLEEVEKGTPPTRAFESAFGVTGEELLRRLGDVVPGQRFRSAALRVRATPSRFELRPIAADDVLTRLGWLSIWLNKPDQAAKYFHMAGSKNVRNARARAGLASAERLREHWDEANPHYAAALAGAPSDAIVQLEAAHSYRQRAEAASDPESRADLAARARLHYQRSIDASPRVAEPHAGVGATYLIRGEPSAQSADPLERARELQPSSLEIELLRAESAVARGHLGLGRHRALNVVSRTHSRKLSHAACGLVHRIDRCRLASVEVDPSDPDGPEPGAGGDNSSRNLCGIAQPEQWEPCD